MTIGQNEGSEMHAPQPTMSAAMLRGAACKCPKCGEGTLFRKFLKVRDNCDACGEDLSHQRADDMPAYIVISIVGHIVIGLLLWVETNFAPDIWVHIALWFPLTIGLSLALLQPVKGMIVAVQWYLGMHGFGDQRALAAATQDTNV
jgi:uncharacterized protein (DUF983 family)